jgi:lipopolysaccharide export system permease protein
VFKKLDKLVVRAFIGPFLATFFITLLVLIMQFFWLYIDDFVSKGLDTKIIFEFILYLSATLVPLALPLAVLLSSLMTFGNLGESFELVAIKSSGISFLRFMRPLFIVSVFIAGIAFLFANYIIPVANLKQRTLLSDIVYAKPAFDLKEGVFYDRIPGFAIKVGKKEENDSIIRDVIVYEQGNSLQDNFIIAKSGVMRVTANKRFLEFNLKDGVRYQERGNTYQPNNIEFIRLGFKEYNKQFDLGSLGFNNRTADSVNRNNEKMFSMRQLRVAIDSLEKERRKNREQNSRDMFLAFPFAAYMDSVKKEKISFRVPVLKRKVKSFSEMLPDSARSNIDQTVRSGASSIRMNSETLEQADKDRQKNLRRHKIEWHRKITLSLACIVLFLIGAPLGSIIRKGGIGTPVVFAIIFFMVFYFSSTTGEKMAKENSLTPFTGMWLASFILLPIGLFLTNKALHDSQLFNKELYKKKAQKIAAVFKKTSGGHKI